MSDDPTLRVCDLHVGIKAVPLVKGVTFQVERGEMLALVGESGCGKSLTAFAITRLLPKGAQITGGSIDFGGVDLAAATERDMRDIRGRKIGLVLQEPMTSLNPLLTVGTQVAEPLLRHLGLSKSAARKRVQEIFELVGIREPGKRFDQYPHHFSGGMRQRIAIAIAISCNPGLLIADEPTTALDVTIQAQVMDLLNTLRRELSMSVILITHDLGVVAQWADRVCVMYGGRIVETASVARIFRSPAHPYSSGLIGASRASHVGHYDTARLYEIPGTAFSARYQPGCSFAPRCGRAEPTCRDRHPSLSLLGPGHSAACFHPEVDT
jgi:peptide/nickel transport system ATP-binding protein